MLPEWAGRGRSPACGRGPTRIPFRPPDEPPVSEFLPHNAWADQDWDWPSLRLAAQPDGSSIFTGSLTQPDYEGNDQCRYLNVRAVISADGLVRQSQWTRDCPRVEPETFIATSAYGPVMVKGPPSPHKTQAQALATLRPGAAKEWWSLAEAANKTCASAPRQFRSQIISVDEAGTRTETALQVDGSVTDPGSGQPSFSMTLNGAPVAGWNPAQKYWVRIGLQGLGIPDSTWQKAVTAAGVPDAQIIVDVPEKWLRSGVLPMSFVPGPAIYATSACSFVGPVDERNIDGQDGPVTRAARPNDVTLWTVGRGKPRLIVTADATGVITGITLVGKGKGRGPVYSMSRDRGAVVPAAGPAVSYQQVAAALE